MKPIIAANWKMNLQRHNVDQYIRVINDSVNDFKQVQLIVCPPHCYLSLVSQQLNDGQVCSQNISEYKLGAYTGEISAEMIKSCGVNYTLLGHSERRHVFNETNEMITSKLALCNDYNICPILCVGETLDQRTMGTSENVISEQLDVLKGVSKPYIIAYEPVWAIGTGKTATPDLAQNMHGFIRKIIGDDVPILYGGSVNSKNIINLLGMPDVNGALVGGASLNPSEFSHMLSMVNNMGVQVS